MSNLVSYWFADLFIQDKVVTTFKMKKWHSEHELELEKE